ncbi:MAG: DEAD/DEAH box helicase [Lentisphaeria bacterium]
MFTLQQYLENNFAQNITGKIELPPVPGQYTPIPETLASTLKKSLESKGIVKLYAHQRQAFEAISQKKDTLIVSRTASGKTLAFLLPILNEYLNEKTGFSVLFLYPTKALSRDQENTLISMLKAAGRPKNLGVYDGDTSSEDRQRLQRSADFIITNPDMLHAGILPNHQRNWNTFLSRLRYIVIDEVHTYRGSFGSHVANVLRRLLRICALHNSTPSFICCSATIGNPLTHVNALCRRDFQLIDQDTSPHPPRTLYCANPSLIRKDGIPLYRKGTASLAIPLIRKATELGIRTICFCHGRQEVERLTHAATDRCPPQIAAAIKPYRGGLLPTERRKLERDLFHNKINTIITTNALELGIDIGDLELCIICGHPGSIASFWQQAGRVGRQGKHAVIVFLAKDSSIDQYLVNHPNYLVGAPIEQAWLNADNPYILLQHLPCAAYEHPLSLTDSEFPTTTLQIAAKILQENGTLKPWRDCLRFALSDYPARGVNLRGMTDYNIDIYCGTEIIGEIDPIGARGTLYKDAIYQHLGKRYMSLDLDLDKKLCRVEEVHVDYFTEASWENRIELTDTESQKQLHGATLQFGAIHVNKQPKLYKKIRERSFENIGYGPITLPAFEYDTMGFAIHVPEDWQQACDAQDKRWLGAALYGLSYLLKHTTPALCMADISDIDTDSSLIYKEKERWKNALYLFDTHEGGVGYAEKIYEMLPTALELCQTILQECPCKWCCPACVPPLPPGVIDSPDLVELLLVSNASTRCTQSLLTALITGRIEMPVITTLEQLSPHPVQAPDEDQKLLKLNNRLQHAADILKKKREKLH